MPEIKDGNYVSIQSFMVKDLELKGNELLIYAIIYGFSQTSNQEFTGSLQYLANWTNSSKQGVLKNLKNLQDKGLVIKCEKNVYGVNACTYKAVRNPVTDNQPEQNESKKPTVKTSEVDFEFAQLWELYPRKIGKPAAYKSYVKARKNGTDFQTVKNGIERYIQYIRQNKKEEYIKYGSTWFNQQGWLDEYGETEQPDKSGLDYILGGEV
jgi:hypothetical protein